MDVNIAAQAVQTVARDRSFHPVRQYLESLKWDGVERLDSWLSIYVGAEDADYTRAVGARWLVSAVARVHRPARMRVGIGQLGYRENAYCAGPWD